MPKPSISVFFPCYNDAGTIHIMALRALQVLREISDDYEVYVFDDGSSDDSPQVLEELQRIYPDEFWYETHEKPYGYGGQIRAAVKAARKEWFFYTDGDAQYDARELALLVEKIGDDVDVVNGYKIKRQDPWIRIVIGYAYQYFIKFIFGLKIRDVDCDFRLMRRKIFDVVELESSSGTITFEMVKKIQDAGYRFVEVPVHHYYRQYGTSQFFNFSRVGRTLWAIGGWWWRLVVKQEAKRQYAPKRANQLRGLGVED
ncbi:MAG: Undecaprenyl-phosphate 4-deoxy-4-formamido-L-arabinose transferase [Anaerolineae bacterium]|nr:Undecaprenyl-phosphate 4-deoxy-4-formamido-L-arabinose transferase [Anaerolineae bacterium]RIK20591.1 MAG: glycosyltransferase family 2 protein [Chloroflexota bacterium]